MPTGKASYKLPPESMGTPFRQARELAEGQKGTDVKCISRSATPAARQEKREMAERVGFPEKNTRFGD
jgi:hypothetical protein